MLGTRRFPRACVASPHHLASAAGVATLSQGGNAVDAAVAANLVLAVVTPYHCGVGGDLFATVWDGEAHAYAGAGRAPAAATLERVRDEIGEAMPSMGGMTVTVPGAVRGWFDLLERFGRRSFGELATRAIGYARDGFVVSEAAMEFLGPAQEHLRDYGAWRSVYREAAAGKVLRQPALARTLEVISEEGPEAFYAGAVAEDIVETVRARHGLMTEDDLAAHRGDWVTPLSCTYRDVDVLEHPPPTQGITALTALAVLDVLGALPTEQIARTHLQIEAVKVALADRDEHLGDPDHLDIDPEQLLAERRVQRIAAALDPRRAAPWRGREAAAGTAAMTVADADGMLVSLLQSNYQGFGSGLHVPQWGINLHDRGAMFVLEPDHPNAIGPGKRPLHTLIPGMVLRAGEPYLVFGTMGGDGQAQTHVQLLGHIVDDGTDLQTALDSPRWVIAVTDASVILESGPGSTDLAEGLERLGHRVTVVGRRDHLMGHAHAISVDGHGYSGATDQRTEGAVLGY
ncbi:MAG: gamma-glutamyltransferase family protein [Actinobacteria bacterium]|nr:gamma-glutamyltransferase family protein [Actinomycetota bacterium]